MRRGTKILAAIVGAAFAGWLGWRLAYPSYSWRQKLTVAVETPEGVKAGSSVAAVEWRDGPDLFPDAPHVTSSMRGEATVVDLGGGRTLFALIGGSERRALRAFSGEPLPPDTDSLMPFAGRAADAKGQPPVALSRENYPLMVTFTDIADPKTVKRVDPDNLAATFGPGTRLASVTLTITDEPVTEGKVEEVLGWLSEVWPNRLDGDRFGNFYSPNRFANSLSANSFSTEIRK